MVDHTCVDKMNIMRMLFIILKLEIIFPKSPSPIKLAKESKRKKEKFHFVTQTL